jgi:opacity protein-like surface antigen
MKIDCNVNNSISHPPHPRRAVPANLPPGAFFFFRGAVKWFPYAIFTTSLCLSSIALHASDDDLFQKIAELRLKSNAHGRFVNELLVNEPKFDPIEAPIQTSIENNPFDTEPESAPSLPTVELPRESETQEFPSQPEQLPQPPQEFTKDEPIEEPVAPFTEVPPKTASKEITIEDEVGPTYEELYAPKVPQRRLGYFFGPFIGPVFPDDSAVRTGSGKEGYQSDTGVTAGLRIGNDFGFTRIEGEYGFLTHNIHSPGKSGDVQLHNLQSRLILEKSLGSRADLRGGIGLGLSFIDKNLGGENYEGVGFSYDFLLGWSFRVMDNWSINMDYRHYLTAAHENYDRLQGHVVELSTSFDL